MGVGAEETSRRSAIVAGVSSAATTGAATVSSAVAVSSAAVSGAVSVTAVGSVTGTAPDSDFWDLRLSLARRFSSLSASFFSSFSCSAEISLVLDYTTGYLRFNFLLISLFSLSRAFCSAAFRA